MDLPLVMHKPFGPVLLETMCPKDIINSINDRVEEICQSKELTKKYSSLNGSVPNLLGRDFEQIFFDKEFLENCEFTRFVENISNVYCENMNLEKVVLDCKKYGSGVWVNRYFSGDYTPVHEHGSILSGILFLKIPDKFEEHRKVNSNENANVTRKKHGTLQFLYGQDLRSNFAFYEPEQEVGKIILFPSWLSHLVYPIKMDGERRTLSFNLILENENGLS